MQGALAILYPLNSVHKTPTLVTRSCPVSDVSLLLVATTQGLRNCQCELRASTSALQIIIRTITSNRRTYRHRFDIICTLSPYYWSIDRSIDFQQRRDTCCFILSRGRTRLFETTTNDSSAYQLSTLAGYPRGRDERCPLERHLLSRIQQSSRKYKYMQTLLLVRNPNLPFLSDLGLGCCGLCNQMQHSLYY